MAGSSPKSSERNKNGDQEIFDHDDDDRNDSPIEQVRLTLDPTDDPTLPVLTFRTWVLGLTSCAFLALVNRFFHYRQNPIYIPSTAVQIIALPIGKLMAATLPSKPIKLPLMSWSFTMNPGPFNIKEHVMINLFAGVGSSGLYSLHLVNTMIAFYHRNINPGAAFLFSLSSQMLGYGWAGLFKNYLVDSPYMWWPSTLASCSLFRVMHDKEKRRKGSLTRLQFFLVAFVASFVYYLVPAYFFPTVSAISVPCLIWKNSITAHQLGSGYHGLGLGAFTLDWATIFNFGNPMNAPPFTLFNSLFGFVAVMYVALPLLYYNNVHHARRFPIMSAETFDSQGQIYNISRIINADTFDLNVDAYEGYSKLYLSVIYAFNNIGLSFALFAATLSHVALYDGASIWRMWKSSGGAMKQKMWDVHTRLMKKNYDKVPHWWFFSILVVTLGLGLWACLGFDRQLQLPWWGLLLACGIGFIFTLPLGVLAATTDMSLAFDSMSQVVISYLYPGKPIANLTFTAYGYSTLGNALWFIGDFKLGHYMKIPPKSMFIVQFVGTLVSTIINFGTAWWILTGVKHICDQSQLPRGSPWTCPRENVFYYDSITWGVVGPMRMFSRLGNYPEVNWFWLFGLIAPVPIWACAKMFPEKKWLNYINIPVMLSATIGLPPTRTLNITSWLAVGFFFNSFIFSKYKGWWARYNYILSAAIYCGMAFLGLFLLVLNYNGIYGPNWWGLDVDDHCPLATCPTAPGIKVDGCPVL